jgi:membrane protein HdeD
MQRITSAVILIILGIIILAFPLLGVIPLSLLTGVAVVVLGIALLFTAIISMGESVALGIVELILGILALILGFGFIFYPGLFSFVIALFIFIAGLFMVIAGIAGIATKAGGNRWSGLVTLVLGLIYLIVATFAANPIYLGTLVGLWLLIKGVLMTLTPE